MSIDSNRMSGLSRQLEAKTSSEIPQFVKDEIHLVSYNPAEPPALVGSYSYRLQKYPADIDMINNVSTFKMHGRWHAATSASQIIQSFSNRIRSIAEDIKRTKQHYLLDFKAGADHRYLFTLGVMRNGVLTIDTDFINNVNDRYEAGLYSEEEVSEIYSLVNLAPRNGQQAYDGLTKILRKRFILRWSLEEIIAGRKVLPLGVTMKLTTALDQHQLVKMDVAVMVQGRMMEMSNIWSMMYYDITKREYRYMTPLPKLENVPYDIEKLYWSDMFYSPYKVVKRIFSYSRLMFLRGNDSFERYLRITTGIIGGDLSQLYQIKSELATILDVHELYGHVSAKQTDYQIDGMRARLANNLRLSAQTADHLATMLEQYLSLSVRSHEEHQVKMEVLSHVKKKLEEIINHSALKYLINVGMNPPPLELLPTIETAEELTRINNPINPFCPQQQQKTYNWDYVRQLPIDETSKGGYLSQMGSLAGLDHMKPDLGDPHLMARIRQNDLLKHHFALQGRLHGGCGECGGGASDGHIERDPSCPCCRGQACEEGLYHALPYEGGVDWLQLGKDVLSYLGPQVIEHAPELINTLRCPECPVCKKPHKCKPCPRQSREVKTLKPPPKKKYNKRR